MFEYYIYILEHVLQIRITILNLNIYIYWTILDNIISTVSNKHIVIFINNFSSICLQQIQFDFIYILSVML